MQFNIANPLNYAQFRTRVRGASFWPTSRVGALFYPSFFICVVSRYTKKKYFETAGIIMIYWDQFNQIVNSTIYFMVRSMFSLPPSSVKTKLRPCANLQADEQEELKADVKKLFSQLSCELMESQFEWWLSLF